MLLVKCYNDILSFFEKLPFDILYIIIAMDCWLPILLVTICLLTTYINSTICLLTSYSILFVKCSIDLLYFNTRLTSMECSIDNRRAVILLAKLTGFWNDCFMFFRRSGSNFILNLEHLATHDISILNLQFSMFSDFPTLQYSIILIVSI